MNKIFYLICICCLCLSCVSSKIDENCGVLSNTVLNTIEQDFFDVYREKGKLSVIIKSKEKLLEAQNCSKIKNVKFDTISKTSRYIKLEEYRYVGDLVRLQFSCYNEIEEPYNILYSTSYFVQKDKTLILNKKSSPYIDTLQVKR